MDPIEQLKNSAQEVRLEAEASDRIRARLVAHMVAHPVATQSPYQRFFIRSPFMSLVRKPVAALAVVLLIGLGGATTFATGALPGDVLYPVKVSVIEPMQGFLAVSPEAKAEWKVSVAETRVSEVVQLAVQDKLTPEQGVSIQEGFDQSLGTARDTIDTLSKENPDAATKLEESFTTALDTHEAALNTIASTSSSTNATEAHSFANHIKNKVHGKVEGAPDERGNSGKGNDSNSGQVEGTTSVISGTTATSSATTTTAAATTSSSNTSSENHSKRNNAVENGVMLQPGL